MNIINVISATTKAVVSHFRKNSTIYCFAAALILLSGTACAAFHTQDETQIESRVRSGQMILATINNGSTPIKRLHEYIHTELPVKANLWDVN